ncbi:MAG: glycosyl hydrolase 115 family protein [Chitinophagaceae bacterium]
MKKQFFFSICIAMLFLQSQAQLLSVTSTGVELSTATIVVDQNDFDLVKKAASLLQQDIEAVTGKKIPVVNVPGKSGSNNIIIGSLTQSAFVKKIAAQNKSLAGALEGKWEAYHLYTEANNLVIAGSDRRGTAYGVLELSKQIGVSPWYWWADVPIKKRPLLYINTKAVLSDAPKVKYRGIFINDEAPALSNWSKATFGGFNHQFYAKVFELQLRLRSNYIWPAMWGNAFYDDDSLNIKTADDYGIIIGTSHHEPLMRAHEEWKRYGRNQKWNYDSTETGLKEFWRSGMERAWNEKIVTVGCVGMEMNR